MEKNKIFELKIDENDDISGIDSISLVDEPAIEVNWVAFNKTEEDFHIPDGDDELYVRRLMEKAESEDDLISQGYVVSEMFATTSPNEPSIEDTNEYLVRYKYALNPDIKDNPPIINKTRSFCRELLAGNYVWRVEDMESITNEFGQPAMVWRGGYNCRHKWIKIKYRIDSNIVNKASITKNQITSSGTDATVLGYPEPDTITNKTRNNPKPSTIKNLGLSKEHQFDLVPITISDFDIIPHGEDEANEENKENGIGDTELTDKGKKFAEKLADYAKEHYKKKVISSEIKRAFDTAEIMAKKAKIEHESNPLFNTWNIGKYEGKDRGSFDEKHYVENSKVIVPKGESFDSFMRRMEHAYKYATNSPKNHLFIAHSKVIRGLYALSRTGGKWDKDAIQHYIETYQKMDAQEKPKVSVDYDGVMGTPEGKELVKELIGDGNDVFVISSRNELEGADILKEAKALKIPNNRVLFTDGQPKWQTIKNLHIVKHYDDNPEEIKLLEKNVPTVQAVQFDYDVSGLPAYKDELPKKKKDGFTSHSDYPQTVKDTAKRVLAHAEKNGWGSCGTEVGKVRANQLASGKPLTMDTIHRIFSYLSRHKGDLKSSKSYDEGCGKLMYDAWGGETMLHWCERKINSANKQNMSKQEFATDDDKRITLGPAMIPNEMIFRKDNQGNPYYVFFSAETIKMICEKYMKNKYIDNNDEQHNGKPLKDVYVFESWIKESNNDKSTDYGFEHLPIGTWFVSMKINNDKVWDQIKSGQLKGFSVSGMFEQVSKFNREEMFLYKVAEILKNIKD